MTIIVSPLSQVQGLLLARRPSHMITLLDPDSLHRAPGGLRADRHLKIGVHDICDETEGLLRPAEQVVLDLLAFGRGWNEAQPLLVHCWAGISRSSAAAYVLACERNPHAAERDIAERLRGASALATPNRRIVELADAHLGRGGRMVDAVDAIGRGEPAYENRPFDIPARY